MIHSLSLLAETSRWEGHWIVGTGGMDETQAHLGAIAGLVPDHHHKANTTIKQVPWILWFPNAHEIIYTIYCGLPQWLSGKESRRCRRRRFDSWIGKIPWRRKWQPTPVFLPGKLHEQRSLAGYSPWGRKRVRHNGATGHVLYSVKCIMTLNVKNNVHTLVKNTWWLK